MESVQVGNATQVEVYLAPVSSKVTFTCEYPTVVNVASQNMTVNGATAVGTTSATGSLADGFSLSLGAPPCSDFSEFFYGQNKFSNSSIFTGISGQKSFLIRKFLLRVFGIFDWISGIFSLIFQDCLGFS